MQTRSGRLYLSLALLVAFLAGTVVPQLSGAFWPTSVSSLPATATAEPQSAAASAVPVADHVSTGTPESVGIDSPTLAKVDELMARRIASGQYPGGVVLVARRGVVVKHTAYGNAVVYGEDGKLLPTPIPTRTDTLYDLASLTKLYTATATLTLVDAGKIELDAPVARYLPEFGANGKEAVTIRHLLTHTSGLPAGLALEARGNTPEERLQAAYEKVKLQGKPGEKYLYSDAGPIVLGKVIERVTGVSLDAYLRQAVLSPLGLRDTTYRPDPALRERVSATSVRVYREKTPEERLKEILKEIEAAAESAQEAGDLEEEKPKVRPRPTLIWGEVHDGEAYALDGVSGNAGLFATAEDVAVLGQMMLNGGSFNGVQVLTPETAAAALQHQNVKGEDQGLGWELGQDWYMGAFGTSDSFGHTGFTGTSLIVCPEEELVIVVLTNRLHTEKKASSTNTTRTGVADIVFAALRD